MKPLPSLPRRTLLARTMAAALLAAPALLLMGATPPDGFRNATFENDDDRLVVVTVHWQNRAQLQRVAAKFQHLIVDEQARTARTEASRADLAALQRMGVRYDIEGDLTDRMRRAEAILAKREIMTQDGPLLRKAGSSLPSAQSLVTAERAIPGYACYRTVEETYSTMDTLATRRPNLARVVDIGPSWSWNASGGSMGYRMRALRITNTNTDAAIADKPNMVLLGAIHAREYTTAELLTRFAEWLVDGYGTDSDATWLVDNFRFHFILQGNPDGRKRAESGLSWRKNTNNQDGTCSSNAFGVDLNRNFPWRFNTVSGGSSGDPCDATYRGSSASSEEETQNLMRYIVGTPGSGGTYAGGALPDRRTDTGAAPSDYRGMFLDIHSFSQMVLWPWAYTSGGAPNAAGLRTLGRRIAYFNNYSPRQWIGLYAADGTNTDSVYGISGAPSYTIELGQEFFEDCSTFESTTFPQNLNALRYAARNLQAPYVSAGGPDTTSIGASAGSVVRGQPFAVSAWVDDARFNQGNGTEAVQRIVSATARLNAPPWSTAGLALAMQPSDGAFDSSREQVVVNIDTRNFGIGRHVVYVRGTDSSGASGAPRAIHFHVRSAAAMPVHDFNGDGTSDVLWRNGSSGANALWRSANSATTMPVTSVYNTAWRVVGQGDFNGDKVSDLVWRNVSTGANVIWRSANSANSQAVLGVTNSAWRIVATGDFDGDGRSDLFWRNAATGQNTIWRSANHAAQIAVTGVANPDWEVAGAGDFNGDGRSDIVWRNKRNGANAIWRSGNAGTPQAIVGVTDVGWKIAGIGDFDGDGMADLFWRHAGRGSNTIWRSANNALQLSVLGVASTAWRVASVGDYDGDGRADLFWRNSSSGANVVWRAASYGGQQAVSTTSGGWVVVPIEQQP